MRRPMNPTEAVEQDGPAGGVLRGHDLHRAVDLVIANPLAQDGELPHAQIETWHDALATRPQA
eukprot:1709521-Alexandrium_andersonii.AAC.1